MKLLTILICFAVAAGNALSAQVTAKSGATVEFSVTADGTTPFNYQWKKNGSDIPGATLSKLTLAAITSANAGDYTVLVSNSAGSATSNAVTLAIILPPSNVIAGGIVK